MIVVRITQEVSKHDVPGMELIEVRKPKENAMSQCDKGIAFSEYSSALRYVGAILLGIDAGESEEHKEATTEISGQKEKASA